MAPPEANDISLDLLRTLVTFSEVGRVEETARHLKLTQAAVSLQLKKLEQELKVPLFTTVGRKKVLTDEARDLVHQISPLFRSFNEVFQKSLKKPASDREFVLRVGCPAEVTRRVLPLLKHEGPLKIFAMDPDESLRALREDRVDLAIVDQAPADSPFHSKKLFQDDVKLVVHKSLLQGRSGHWASVEEHLASWPLIGTESSYLDEVAEHMKLRSRDFNQRYFCGDSRAALEMVSLFKGWALLVEHQIEKNENWVVIDMPFIHGNSYYVAHGPQIKLNDFMKGTTSKEN